MFSVCLHTWESTQHIKWLNVGLMHSTNRKVKKNIWVNNRNQYLPRLCLGYYYSGQYNCNCSSVSQATPPPTRMHRCVFLPSNTLEGENGKSLQNHISERIHILSVYTSKRKKNYSDNQLLTSVRTHIWKIWLFWVNMNISVSSGIFSVSITFFPFLGGKHRWMYNARSHRREIIHWCPQVMYVE